MACRFLKLPTLHPRVLRGNRVAPWSILITAAIMVRARLDCGRFSPPLTTVRPAMHRAERFLVMTLSTLYNSPRTHLHNPAPRCSW